MKVSNNINVTNISQNQIKKLQEAKTDKFDQMLQNASNDNSGITTSKLNEPAKTNSLASLTKPEVAPAKTTEEMAIFAQEALEKESDIRFEKVNHIKALVDSGNYNIAPEAVAEKLWASGVVRHLW
jgi:anti-sigma28 factor (negative regulator of flagellin synthesis)